MYMISYERSIQKNGEPLASKEKEDVDKNVKNVLRQNQRIQTRTLIYRILVISFQFIKCNYLKRRTKMNRVRSRTRLTYVKDCKKEKECINDESYNVSKSCKCECHSEDSEKVSNRMVVFSYMSIKIFILLSLFGLATY